MRVPEFILRKIYRRGSLRATTEGRFQFELQNPLGTATLTGPPRIVVNGVAYEPKDVKAPVDLAKLSPAKPYTFTKGDHWTLEFPGRLMRGANRIHMVAPSKEFGEVEIFVEDDAAAT